VRTLTRPRGGTVEVRIEDIHGRPLGSRHVQLFLPDGEGGERRSEMQPSDVEGRAVFTHVPAGRVRATLPHRPRPQGPPPSARCEVRTDEIARVVLVTD